ncbi:carbohydrate binding family 9 domain-containing protein [Glaciecola sp. MH2013]|uniref:carbohydrate binding family 9 domain-containing protein n=1 Tax=Glaciecola sp. MH2013 TaxID=2785524 RepID=UPI00189DD803|nr:carbohydrate binding family 9 domain-containing protein [Glaciecola sp. MH2013]MBF7074156.1 carbohydrate binding family 9 domain-containing protein [Glaciecola sp. MH2013]
MKRLSNIANTFVKLSLLLFCLLACKVNAANKPALNVDLANSDSAIQTSELRQLTIPSIDETIIVDGELTEAVWKTAQRVKLNYVHRPFDNTQPPVQTTAYFYEDGNTFYLAFVAEDFAPEQIRSFLRDRDKTWGQDMVGVKIDTYNDGRLAYQFYVNPLGVQTDSIENEMTGNESASWNGIWQSEGILTDEGFQVEMAIPLRLMNFEESDDIKSWGIEFVRFYPRSDEYRISHLPFDRNNACTLCQMGEASGFKEAKQGNNLAIVPTAVLGASRERDPTETNEWDYDNAQEVGLDLNWAITPEMSVQATLNPDFSQVEADNAQLNINNTFALFFDEQRPFFVANADYFTSFQNLIYTRNVNAPDYGVKLTGRKEQHSVGVFVANDETTTFLVPGNLGSSVAQFDAKSTNAAARYRFDYSDRLALGAVVTARDADNYHNYVTSFDAKYRISEQDTLRAQVIVTDTQYPDDLFEDFCNDECINESDKSEASLRTDMSDSFTGRSFYLDYRHENSDYDFRATRQVTDENYRADLGFQSRVDRKVTIIGGGYNWWNENSWWNRIRLSGDWDQAHNMNGELLERELEAQINIRGNYQSFAQIGAVKRTRTGLREFSERLDIVNNATYFDEESMSLYMETKPNQYFFISNFMRKGDAIDFANNRLGEQLIVEPTIDINLGTHLRFRVRHTYSKLDSNSDNLFVANLSDLRMTYQFDQRQFFRVTLAYADISRNLGNYLVAEGEDLGLDAESRDLGVQLLYSYKLNPLTKFFVGYADSAFENDELNKLKVNGQSIFMKFSYAWLQ